MTEYPLSDPEGLLVLPTGEQPRCALLVLTGSSGRIATDRTRLLARHGAAAMSLRWFGGAGQPSGICEVRWRPSHRQWIGWPPSAITCA